MKIAILTMFNGLSTTYSLVNVVSTHIKMMLDNNIDVTIIVTELLKEYEKHGIFLDSRLKWIKIKNSIDGNQIVWHDYSYKTDLHDTFFYEVEHYKNEYVKKLYDFDVLFMHDILYQGWHLCHNLAIRKALQELNIKKIIEFTHSLPIINEKKLEPPFNARFKPLKNCIFAYPTESGLKALSAQYNIPINQCKKINNCLDVIENLDKSVGILSQKTDLLSPDILAIYPTRLTTAKKLEKIVMLLGAIKKYNNKSVKVIFTDFNSADTNCNLYKNQIILSALHSGLSRSDVVFTSDYGFTNGFPRKGVLDLFTLSNIFICPSYSESFGLTVIEAGSRGNFIIVNKKVPALDELGKDLNLYFMNWDALNFGFSTTENYNPSEEAYYKQNSKNILLMMESDRSLMTKTKIRQQYSTQYIWDNQLKPILLL